MDNTIERVSLFLSECLDALGYSEEMVLYRRKAAAYLNNGFTNTFRDYGMETTIVGSAAEGIATPFQSDLDLLLVKGDVTCYNVDDGHDCENKLLFKCEREGVPPGYTLLKLYHRPAGVSFENDVYFATFGKEEAYLWSTFYHNRMKCKIIPHACSYEELGPVLGPALGPALEPSIKAHIGTFRIDFPLSYVDRAIQRTFSRRQRRHGWPSEELVGHVSTQKMFVLPQSSPDSDKGYLEWRICFNQAELLLFKRLNITQVKLFILLKMIAKSELRPISRYISSYILKNLVFWMAELYPLRVFQESNLILLVLTALGMLYNGLRCGNIPCYMSEGRNLLLGNLDLRTKYDLLQTLTQLAQEKGCMFIRCEKLRHIMLKKLSSPNIIEMYGNQRNKLEMRLLILNTIQNKYMTQSNDKKTFMRHIMKDEDWIRVAKSVYDMVYPGWMERQACVEETLPVFDRIRQILG